jgi:ABC-type iron transport system FetAB ATPase subunit
MPTLELDAIRHCAGGPFSLSLSPGECVGLQGPSGSGKTLLLRAVADLDPHEGEARLDGRSASTFRPSDWRRSVTYLPAESAWWEETVRPHFPSTEGSDLTGLLSSLGFDSEVMDWSISRLSTGERQRLAFARMLVRSPKALLLDEPTASLDAENTERIESLVASYHRAHAAPVLLVSHDPGQLIRMTDRSYRIAGGSLSPSGLDAVKSP